MERKIIYAPEVKQFLRELVRVLYEKEYFGFRKDAKEYVTKIKIFIDQRIGTYPAKFTPIELKEYGEKYLLYKANANTTWYIFYSQDDERYFVELITNNHSDFIAKFNL